MTVYKWKNGFYQSFSNKTIWYKQAQENYYILNISIIWGLKFI